MYQGLSLSNKMMQTLTVSPQMIQTLKIVQYSTPELLEYISHEMADNPFLEEIETKELRLDTDKENIEDEKFHNNPEREENIGVDEIELHDTVFSKGLKSTTAEYKDKAAVIEKTAYKEKTLSDILIEQLGIAVDSGSAQYEIGEIIIGSLDENGYFKDEVKTDILEKNTFDVEVFDKVLDTIKEFEPIGIASSSIVECLYKQLDVFQDIHHDLAADIILHHFSLLQKKKFKELAKIYNTEEEEIANVFHIVTLLEPNPARKYSSIDNTYVVPDVYVRQNGDDFRVIVNNEVFPNLILNKEYKQLKKTKDNIDFNKYLHVKEESANILINSIKYRQSNLSKVVDKLLEIQRGFFLSGPSALKPYTLVKLAEEININQGTLSRIINSKYVDTDWGLFSLRVFFSSSISSNKGDVSSSIIKEEIRAFIEGYTGKKKLSDQKIVEYLNKKGFKVARRTVTKYRNQSMILSSFHR